MAPPPIDPADPDQPADSAREHLDQVFSAAYEELRRLAGVLARHERSQTLNPTALVHEAWIKLSRSPQVAAHAPVHFRRIAARAMRQVLVDAARRRLAAKRGGEDVVFVTFDDASESAAASAGDLVVMDGALERLALLDRRQAQVVECRFFAGLDSAETAEALGISLATVDRDWRAARAWLAAEVARDRGDA